MADRTEATHQAILDFIGRFEPERPCTCIGDLYDGVIFWLLMQRITELTDKQAAFNFEPSNLASVLANLKLIVQHLEGYYSTLKRPWERDSINLIEIAHHKNQKQIVKLFMLVLAAAIESDCKQTFIYKIMTLPQESQVAFVGVIKCALGEGRANDELHSHSPKTEQSIEKRLLEKLEELEMENDRLHATVKELQEDKALISGKLSAALDTIASEQRENERLSYLLRESMHASDLKSKEAEKEKSDAHIQNLKSKLLEVSRAHEKYLSKLREELEMERSGFVRLHQLQEQVEYYQEKYEECKEIMLKFERVECERARLAKHSEEKDEAIHKLKERITELTEKLYELEERDVYDKMELYKKSTRIEELYREIELAKARSEQFSQHSLPLKTAKSLSEICPEINQGDSAHLKDHNQTLLADLEKSTKKIRMLERDLERYKREADRTHSLEVENKKLEEILLEYNQTRGEENELLVGCLYEMRMKYRELSEQNRKDARPSLPIRNHAKHIPPKKILS